jgi:hypothetical protein
MSDYGEKLLRLLVAEAHCLTVLIAAQQTFGKAFQLLSLEQKIALEKGLAEIRVDYTDQLSAEGVDPLLTHLPSGPTKIQ